MSDEKKFLDLTKQIEILREQQEAIISDYSTKVSVLSKEIKILEAKKADVIKDILALENTRDSLPGVIENAKKEAQGIIGAAKAEAEEVRAYGLTKANEIIEAANAREAEAKAVVDAANKKESEANEKTEFANKHYVQAKKLNMDAEVLFSDANKRVNDAISLQAKAEEVLANAKVKHEAVELAEKSQDTIRKAIALQRADIDNEKVSLKDAQDAMAKEKASFLASMDQRLAEIKDKEAEVTLLRDQLIKQKEANTFKVAELDSALAKVKREQSEIKKQQAVIDNMKKELSK